jgi:hypothetical protein
MAKTLPLPANQVGSPCETRSFASGNARQISRSRVTRALSALASALTGWVLVVVATLVAVFLRVLFFAAIGR